ncbi:hypothetical protein P7H71_03060 [Lactococcus lactis]|uniref:Uncharacterized protein n=1 Tax=Lactococcus lactis TaxID=1358 RepID=A0AAP5P4D3_9LACT|nr:hypothetical protein [Lactococcus lactis]MDT2858517.1 hypothetical protein [Lactococcus lactis]MDT2866649.1 hypothetical protein [Lactococcus lactis]MDT2872666.1 hypothetical protein [Lactococcus lactis]MDT2877573.1 hypothetical protein [Lactococcus lactis]MDT2880075.1 hypothetical protein [Lactococcus lactis]
MKLVSQFSEIESEYRAVDIQFETRCCLDWDNEVILFEAHRTALQSLSHLKNVFKNSEQWYKKYCSRINERYEIAKIV